MKTHDNKLFIPLPEGATDVDLFTYPSGLCQLVYMEDSWAKAITLPKDYKLIGTTPLTEEEWQEVVELANEQMVDVKGIEHWKDYTKESWEESLPTATESGLSLLEHLGLDISKPIAVLIKTIKPTIMINKVIKVEMHDAKLIFSSVEEMMATFQEYVENLEVGEKVIIEVAEMTTEELEALPEFEGF